MLGNVSSKDRTSWYVSPRTLDEKTKEKTVQRVTHCPVSTTD